MSAAGGMDIRLPMGLMFSIIGAIITIWGAVTQGDPMYDKHSLGININLWWGMALLVFGFVMLLLTWLASAAQKKQNP